MGDVIQAVGHAPVVVGRDGSMVMPEMEFAPGGVLFVRQGVSKYVWLEDAGWFAPDVGLAAVVIGLVVGVVVALRVARRPREWGRLFCRRCNYKIVPPMAGRDGRGGVTVSAGARCPECGVELEKKRPVIGRPRVLRTWVAWAVCVPLVVAGMGAMAVTLERKTTWRGAWPVAGADRFMGAWAVQKKDFGSRRGMPDLQRISRYGASGASVGAPWELEESLFYAGRVTPDGKQYLCITMASGSVAARVEAIDTATGEHREAKLPQWTAQQIVGFSRDGKSAFVQMYANTRANSGDVSLVRMDLGTLEGVEIARLPIAMTTVNGSTEWPQVSVLVDDSGGAVRWVAQVSRTDASRKLMPITVVYFDGAERKEYTVPVTAGARSWYWPRLMDGGKTLEVSDTSMTCQKVDLATGTITAGTSSWSTAMAFSPNWKFRVDKPAAGAGPMNVVETGTGRVVGTIGTPAGLSIAGSVTVSNDGRYVGAAVWAGGLGVGFVTPRGEIEIWDLGEGK